MDILIYVTVIVTILYIHSRVVRKRLYRRLMEIHIYYRHEALEFIRWEDAVGLLKLMNSRERAIKELMPWLRP